ncbi:MAG: YebC/PmpR family DNA-binding transcriptional regulator [Oscillospiraceae bacterium]|nr:YebC/PmpR family DNA-binding transcriptional regulator [Oscillospiraceae bacterium]
MSGHSKWANIKHRKGKSDEQKGRAFTRIGREIAVIVRQGGPDPNVNYALRDVIVKAKRANMPGDNIAKCIKKASGEGGSEDYESLSYEGYGPGGVAVIIEAMTDNRNRTAGDVRHLLDKHGGNLGSNGCVSYLFDRKGLIVVDREGSSAPGALDEDAAMMEALDAGAEDFKAMEGWYEVITDPSEFYAVSTALESKGYAFLSAEVGMVPKVTVGLADPRHAGQMERMIDAIEGLDDVQGVFHNWDQ